MNERGFALVTVLWLVAALSIYVGGSMTAVRLDIRAAQNRIALERAEWAAEACTAILSEKYRIDQTTRTTDTVDLGSGTWCRATSQEPSARLNVNTADEETLDRLIIETANQGSGAAEVERRRVRDLRPIPAPDPPRNFADVAELAMAGRIGEGTLAALSSLLTVRGDGRVNLLTADARIVRSLSMLTASQANQIIAWRRASGPVLDQTIVATMLDAAEIPLSAEAYRALVQQTSLTPTVFVIEAVGGIDGSLIRGRRRTTAIPVGGRLAVVRREVP